MFLTAWFSARMLELEEVLNDSEIASVTLYTA